MEKVYNKLVRDNIPELMIKDGWQPYTRVLNDSEYKQELELKLNEEYQEVLKTTTSDERIEELADMLEIISALAGVEGKSLDDVVKVAKQKKLRKGGFEKKFFLEKVEE